ncbi:MAG: NapC/NirT family cytochrome c [Wenzhouxiangella sp.]|jgi:nitrate/TMAO reductase-like tetraheme cytochrome c subunit|nr:NapC/NirT family cytochrome c [Wenzhouxiangella sp.]
MAEQGNRPNFIVRFFSWIWNLFTKPAAKLGAGVLVIVGVVVGIAGWQTKMTVIDVTSTTAFCTSCHEMEAFVLPAVAQGVHWNNASGVRAECKDCHVPKEYFPKMGVKINAGLVELPSHFMGKLGTEEKYNSHRSEMAHSVWEDMRANDSRECRNCHEWEAMAEADQSRPAWMLHQRAQEQGQTCIDCHDGVAHGMSRRDYEKQAEATAAAGAP